MAGITAFIRYQGTSPLLADLLCKTLRASYPLPELKTVLAQSNSREVALGGTFPKHFQRDSETAILGGKTLLFYGELYNKLDGKTEAELALQSITGSGSSSLELLNGPFVFFMWDDVAAELTIVTDRLGRFPVFYCEIASTTVVTTDLHSLLNGGVIAPELREEGLSDFLTVGFPLGEESLFRGIRRLSGGQIVTFSRKEMTARTYWEPRYLNVMDDIGDMVDAFEFCVDRAVRRSENTVVTLSGGWDSRATISVAHRLHLPVCAVTYGVTGSADAELAALVAENLHVRHMLITPEKGFFDSFSDWTRKVIALSNGHATIDLAFQIYVYDRLSEHFPAVLDSAGCEFRRGIRGRLAAARAKCTHDISIFLTTMYATGIWNETMIDADFYHTHASATIGKLTDWLDTLQCATYRGLVDAFSTSELWAHHYAHGYPLQTNVIACRMPFSDNEFYDTLLAAVSDIRWSHRFHRGVIRRFAPSLERIAVSHGSCKVPYGESITRYVPLLYHGALSHLASTEPLSWLRSFDNYKPFRPYHHWYSNELEEYVSDTLSSATVREYVNPSGINDLLRRQHREPVDHSHGISILLTLVHLLEYARGFRGRRPEIC